MELSYPRFARRAKTESSSSPGKPGIRDRILLVFDEAYNLNGNVVYAATRHLVAQVQGPFDYRVFCRGKYKGPRFERASRVQVVGHTVAPFAQGMRLRERIARKLAEYCLIDSADRWICNLDADENSLLRLLFDADRYHAVVVFTHDPAYGLRIAKLAHVFSAEAIPHLAVVTPALQIPPRIVQDLRWLGGRVLRDGEPVVLAPADGDAGNGERADGAVPDLRAVLNSFDSPRALSFLDRKVYPYQANAVHPVVMWPDWIGVDQPYRPRVQDVVLFIRPDWMNCGSGTLFESVANWIRENDGLLIDIGIWPYRVGFDAKTRDEYNNLEQRHIRSALYFSVRRSNNILYLLRRLATAIRFFPRTVASQVLLQYAFAAMPPMLVNAVRRARITHIYLNHYFTYAWARDLIQDRKFFLDTHDIQAINYVHNGARNLLTRRNDRFPAILADEMRVARRADRLGFVSEAELEIAAGFIPREKLHFIIPLPAIKPCAPKDMSERPSLLIVASGNPANLRNLNWFLTEVWPLLLAQAPAGAAGEPPLPPFDVVICGSIVASMPDVDLPGIRFMGVVEDLRAHYESCDVVLTPVISGGGVGIKTVEAVLYERPVVATYHALRGLPRRIVDIIGYATDAEMFARQIVEITTSKATHTQQADRSRRGARALRDENFYQRLGQAMDAVRLNVPRAAGTGGPAASGDLVPASAAGEDGAP